MLISVVSLDRTGDELQLTDECIFDLACVWCSAFSSEFSSLWREKQDCDLLELLPRQSAGGGSRVWQRAIARMLTFENLSLQGRLTFDEALLSTLAWCFNFRIHRCPSGNAMSKVHIFCGGLT